jgi:hypothetical protein
MVGRSKPDCDERGSEAITYVSNASPWCHAIQVGVRMCFRISYSHMYFRSEQQEGSDNISQSDRDRAVENLNRKDRVDQGPLRKQSLIAPKRSQTIDSLFAISEPRTELLHIC